MRGHIYNQKYLFELTFCVPGPSFIQAVLFLASVALYFCGRMEYLGFMVFCLALSWMNLLYFSRGSKNMGIYSVMIQKVSAICCAAHLWMPFVVIS